MGETGRRVGETRWLLDSVVLLILRKTGVKLDICQSVCQTRCPLSPWLSQSRQSWGPWCHMSCSMCLFGTWFICIVYQSQFKQDKWPPLVEVSMMILFGMKQETKTKNYFFKIYILHSSNTQTHSSVCNVTNKEWSSAFSHSFTNTISKWPASEEHHDYVKTCDHIQIWGMMEHEVGLLSRDASGVRGEITAVCWVKCCNLLCWILCGLWREEAWADAFPSARHTLLLVLCEPEILCGPILQSPQSARVLWCSAAPD